MTNFGKDFFKKEQLQTMVLFSSNWLEKDSIFMNPYSKYGLLVANTRFGQSSINSSNKKLKQKDFKVLQVNIDEDLYGFIQSQEYLAACGEDELT